MSYEQRTALDVNGDGNAESGDVLLILQRLLDVITEFPQAPPPETQPPAVEPITEPASSAASVREQYCKEVARLVNQERRANGIAPLLYSDTLAEMAQIRAEEAAIRPDHVRPDGRSFGSIFDDYGICCSYNSENLAYWANTPESVMSLWMDSSGHRKNILSRDVRCFGVGCCTDEEGRYYWIQIFTDSDQLSGYDV